MLNRYRENRHTQTEKDTQPTIYLSQQCDTRSGVRAGKIKGVVIKRECFILSHHIVINVVCNSLTKARSHNVYSLSLKLPVRHLFPIIDVSHRTA